MTNLSVKHAHNEAFKLMTYACVCGHRETIWNSRDGVTPFGMECQSCGGMYLRHIDWKSDVYAPDHQLHKDQRFWRDGTPDEAEAIMRRRIEAYRDEHPCTPEKEADLIRIAREGEGEFRQGWPMLDRLERRDLTPSPADSLEPKRWLLEEHMPGGSIRWHCFEHEHQCRARGAASGHRITITALFGDPAPAPKTKAREIATEMHDAALSKAYEAVVSQYGRNIPNIVGELYINTYLDALPPAPNEPVLFVSEKQLEQCIGTYLPTRKEAEGNFQFPLYRHPAPAKKLMGETS